MTDDASAPPVILDARGKPARPALATACPQCGASADTRVASCGFGVRRPCCGVCGFVWQDQEFKD